MKAGDIQVALAQTNRWWRDPGWEASDPDLKKAAGAPFEYRPDVLTDFVEGGLYLLRGPRRAGKSVELKRAIASLLSRGVPPRRVVHASVEGWRAGDLRALVRAANVHLSTPDEGPRHWFLDEVTAVRGDWPNEVKWLRDNHPGFGQDTVVLTGSSAAGLDEAVKALAGRRGGATHADRVLLPMRFTDFCAATGIAQVPALPGFSPDELASPGALGAARELMAWLPELLDAWEAYLRVGGYPEAVSSFIDTRVVDDALTEALFSVVHGEAIRASGFSQDQTLELLATLTRALGGPLNVAGLARDLDVAHATAKARLDDLVRAYLLWPLHRERGLAPHLAARAKLYFTDPLLAALAARRGRGDEADLSRLNEQQVGLALVRSLERHRPTGLAAHDRVLYYRSATGAEIDFVGRDLGGLCVESKYVDDRWGRELRTIEASPWRGVVATRSGFGEDARAVVFPTPVLVALLEG